MRDIPKNPVALALVVVVTLTACGGKDVKPPPAGAQADRYLLDLGKNALERKKWEEARTLFKQLIDTYPRSPLVAEARLGVGDSYFFQRGSGNQVLAIAEYRDFLTFFPNHPRADYAQLQIGKAYFQQINKPDRDQTPTMEAVTELKKLTELYRNSLYAEEGQKLLLECYERLAQHEFNVGVFYLKTRKACRGAIDRFKTALEKYPTFSKVDAVYFQLGEAYQLCGSPLEAMAYYKQLLDNYPKSNLRDEAEEKLAQLQEAQRASRSPSNP
jgi:outer membrane assembly lipoprotein YfiO